MANKLIEHQGPLARWWPLIWRLLYFVLLAYGFLSLLGMPQFWDWSFR